MPNTIIEAIHDFWFGELDGAGLCMEDHYALWFSADDHNDEFCRARFGAWLELALAGKLNVWAETDRGLIALVILLDQLARNIHRGTAQAFAGDPVQRRCRDRSAERGCGTEADIVEQYYDVLMMKTNYFITTIGT